MKLFFIIVTALLVVFYSFMWYLNVMVPAWHVLVWVTLAFIAELKEYFSKKSEV